MDSRLNLEQSQTRAQIDLEALQDICSHLLGTVHIIVSEAESFDVWRSLEARVQLAKLHLQAAAQTVGSLEVVRKNSRPF